MSVAIERVSPFVFMPMGDYRATAAVSKSDLDLIHRSPAHYRQERDCPTPPTPAMLWGTMFHLMILEPDLFEDSYAVLPEGIDRRTREGKGLWAEWEESNEGKIPVDKPTLAELEAMRASVFSHSTAREALSDGLPESCLFWTHSIGTDPLDCKARPDYIIPDKGLLVDIKTCQDARLDPFSRQIWNYRYHVQAAYYLDGYKALTGETAEFLFVAVEKAAPYCVAVYHANEAIIEQGRREYLQDLITYSACLAKDEWPGYSEEIQSVLLPRWAQEES